MDPFKKSIEGYRAVIVRDVTGGNYRKHQRWMNILLTVFGFGFVMTYVLFFHHFLRRSWHVFYDFHLVGMDPTQDPAIRFLIMKYEYLVYFLSFLILLVFFSLIAFFAFDMQQRNELIRRYLSTKKDE